MAGRQFPIEGDGLRVGGNGPRQIVLGLERDAEVEMGRRKFRVDGDGLFVGGDGRVGTALFRQGDSTILMGYGIVRLELDRPVEACDCLIIVSFVVT